MTTGHVGQVAIDLLVGGQAPVEHEFPGLLHGRLLENGARRSGHREEGVAGHVDQAAITERPRQGAPERGVRPPLGQKDPETAAQLVGQGLIRSPLVDAGQWLEAWIGVLHQQPPPGSEDSDHGRQGLGAPGDMDQDQPGVDQVEESRWWWIDTDIVPVDLKGDVVAVGHPPEVDVGGQHRAPGADPLRHPGGNARTAGPDLPATPPPGDPEVLQVSERRRVEQRSQCIEAGSRRGLPIVEKVLGLLVSRTVLVTWFAQDSTRRRKFRSPSPKKSTRKPVRTG